MRSRSRRPRRPSCSPAPREPAGFREAASWYRTSYELAPPTSYGRLVGMLKAAVLGGGGDEEAALVRGLLPDGGSSPTSWYAVAIAALIEGDAALARAVPRRCAREATRSGAPPTRSPRSQRRDGDAARRAIAAIEDDFAARDAHLTGVAIADTAVLFATLLERSAPLP